MKSAETTSEVLANKAIVGTNSQLVESINEVVVECFWKSNTNKVESKISGISTTWIKWVEESTLLSAQVVCGEAEPEEVKRVGAVGTWSNINRWVRVDVTSCAKNDLGIWSADSLVSNLIPLRNLANRPAEGNSLLKSGIGHIGLVPEWALDAES